MGQNKVDSANLIFKWVCVLKASWKAGVSITLKLSGFPHAKPTNGNVRDRGVLFILPPTLSWYNLDIEL